MKLIIVRHGETAYNRKRIMQGYREIPLNDAGIAQAARLAVRLKEEGIDRIVSSDLRRAVMTGCIIASQTGAPMSYEPGLRERDPGDLVGQPYDREPRFFTDAEFVPPGGEGTIVFRARVRQAFEKLVAEARAVDEVVAVVTHGMVCQAFVSEFFGDRHGAAVVSRNTSMSVVECVDGGWSAIRLDCVAHLELAAEDALAENAAGTGGSLC